jgi:hypothetical protein
MNSDIIEFTLVTAFEGGSNHWIDHVTPTTLPLTLTDIEDDQHTITADDFYRVWPSFCANYPQIAERIAELDGSADADDADALLQMVVLDDIVYG